MKKIVTITKTQRENNMKNKLVYVLVVLIIAITTSNICANDYFIEDNGEINVTISRDNINRIKIFHDRINNIRANSDELKVDVDKTNGEIFVKPITSKSSIDVFLKTENGFTYKLILKVKDVKAQQIFLNRENFTLSNYADSDILRREKLKLIDENLYFDFADNYKLSAINLIRAMTSQTKLKQFTIVNRDYQQLMKYKKFKVDWLYSYIQNDKSNISGEIARVTNTSKETLELNEEVFFRNGIRAVRLEKMILEPSESCLLYLVGGE
jgi:type-F conjugative transfer system secretin TraK